MSPVVAFPFIGHAPALMDLADDDKGSVKMLAAPPVRCRVHTLAWRKGSSPMISRGETLKAAIRDADDVLGDSSVERDR
jgi:hypothetical protein